MVFIITSNNDHLNIIQPSQIDMKTLEIQFSCKGLNMGFYSTATRIEKFRNHGNSSFFIHFFTICAECCQCCHLSSIVLKYSFFCKLIHLHHDILKSKQWTMRRTRFCTEKFVLTNFIYGESWIITEVYKLPITPLLTRYCRCSIHFTRLQIDSKFHKSMQR